MAASKTDTAARATPAQKAVTRATPAQKAVTRATVEQKAAPEEKAAKEATGKTAQGALEKAAEKAPEKPTEKVQDKGPEKAVQKAPENWILQYYQKIEDGSVIVGKWVKLLYERIVHGFEAEEFFYDQKKAARAVRFIESFCHHSKGALAPQLVKLQLWQKALISAIFGIVDRNGLRQFREVFVVMGRKCGKSLLASGIAQYMAYADGERGADVYMLAPKLDQTEIVFGDFWQSVSQEPDLVKMTKKRKTDIYIPSTNTSIKKIAFSEKKSDGFNPHLTVCDEVAAWSGEQGIRQYAVMTSALGSREQPLILSITTANYISEGIYDELFKRGTGFLMGNSRERRILPVIYQIDDLEKYADLNELQKSLPNLGVSVSVDYILEEIAKAEESLPNRAEFMTKFCCIKQNSSQAWFSQQDVDRTFGNAYKLEDFSGCYALGGIDLSMTTDLTAAVLLVERGGVCYYFTRFFLPAAKLDEAIARDRIDYRAFVQRGILTVSGENQVDYNDVYRWFVQLLEEYQIYVLMIGYDKYSAAYLVQELERYGFHTEPVGQGYNLTGVYVDMEGMIKDRRLLCAEDNDLMRLHLLDAALKTDDDTKRRMLIKMHKAAHVDGVAALSDAMLSRRLHREEMPQLAND